MIRGFLILLGLNLIFLSQNTISQEENLVINGSFENGLNYWYNVGSGVTVIDRSEPYSGINCLKVQHGDQNSHGVYQRVGRLKVGTVYDFSGVYKASKSHFGYISLYDKDWKWKNSNGIVQTGKALKYKLIQGSGRWEAINLRYRIPEKDDLGLSTAEHTWLVFIYSHNPASDFTPVFYDSVTLAEVLVPPDLPRKYEDIQKMPGWVKKNTLFTDAEPLTDYNFDFARIENGSLFLKGTQKTSEIYKISLPARPDTVYKISAILNIKNRKAYNYLEITDPPYPSRLKGSALFNTKGIWCGNYDLRISESYDGSDNDTILQGQINDSPYISNSEIDWFIEESFIKTSKDAVDLTISIVLSGFDAELGVRGVILEEVVSVIEDKYLHMPVNHEFQGMKIKKVTTGPVTVETNAGKFILESNSIKLIKDSDVIGILSFSGQPDFLANLKVTEEPGIVIIENQNIALSVGSDSSIITKMKADATVEVKGLVPVYHSFEAGIIFVTDYNKGIYFSPVYPTQTIRTMPVRHNYNIIDETYADEDFAKKGQKNWEIVDDFNSNNWLIRYSFKSGDGFVASIFPPKDFDNKKYYKDLMEMVRINLNQYPYADYSYLIQKFHEKKNIALLWVDEYSYSENNQNPPSEYYVDKNGMPVAPGTPDSKAIAFLPVDEAGPYNIKEEVIPALERFVQEAHSQGVKVIVYMSPYFYYNSNPDIFLNNLKANIDAFNLDGVYFDGLYEGKPLQGIELVRKTRDILKDKFYNQHNSWVRSFIKNSDHFRVDFEDAYADRLWVGERVKKASNDAFLYNFTGNNISNTVSALMPELRPVDYSKDDTYNKDHTMTPEKQIDNQLLRKGEFRIFPYTSDSYIQDKNLGIKINFETNYYWEKFCLNGLAYTAGDGVCDTIETIYSCPSDCAPYTSLSELSKNNNIFTVTGPYSVAQWIFNEQPLYKLHFTFDNYIATDDTDYRQNPSEKVGINYTKPANKRIDNRDVFEFNTDVKLFGNTECAMDLTNKDFSAFTIFKKTNNINGTQILFAFNPDNNFYYGIKNSKAYAAVKEKNCIDGIEEISTAKGDKAVLMQPNSSTYQAVYQKIDSLDAGTYTLSAEFLASVSHKGHIELRDVSSKPYKSFFIKIPGSGEGWRQIICPNIKIDTNGHTWYIYLYGYESSSASDAIYYDDVKLTMEGSDGNIIKNGGFEYDFAFWSHGNKVPFLELTGTAEIDDQAWHSIGIVFKDSALSLYLDGKIQQRQENVWLKDFPKHGKYYIGSMSKDDNSTCFGGYIDDLFVADIALSAEQINQYHYTAHKTITAPESGSAAKCIVTSGFNKYTAEYKAIPLTFLRIGDKTVYENSELKFTIIVMGGDQENLICSVSNMPQGAVFDNDKKEFRWKPAYGQRGYYEVRFSISDGRDTIIRIVHIKVIG